MAPAIYASSREESEEVNRMLVAYTDSVAWYVGSPAHFPASYPALGCV